MRKWLKPEIWLIVSGVLLALALSFEIFIYFVLPGTFITMRTALEVETLWWLDSLTSVYEKLSSASLLVLGVLFLTFCIAFMRNIGDNFTFNKLRSIKGALPWFLAICALIITCLVPIMTPFERVGDLSPVNYYLNTIKLKYLVPILGFAIIWVLARANQSKSGWKRHLLDALRGAIVGAVVILFNYLGSVAGDLSGETYYVYHGKPYEYNPYIYLYYSAIYFLSYLLVFVGSAGIAVALSFRNFSIRTRIKWAGFALALCAGLFMFSGIIHFDAEDELNELKKPLAMSAGLSLEEPPTRVVIPLRDKTVRPVKWPITFKFYNPFEIEDEKYKPRKDEDGYDIYPATRDNLAKLTDYSGRAKAGVLIQSEYSQALIGGYLAAGDLNKAREVLVRDSEDFMINRIVAQAMFGGIPTTTENKALFRKFAEGIEWHKDGISGGRLCSMYKYMDIREDGEKWCTLARGRLDEEPGIACPPVNGTIKGIININGAPIRDGELILFRAKTDFETTLFKMGFFMVRALLASTTPSNKGQFEFTGLKDLSIVDGYELAVVFDQPLEYEVLGIDNPPGIINVTIAEKDFDLGVINIRTSKQ